MIITYYVQDHLGNTRVVYQPLFCEEESLTYDVEYVGDYFPYAKTIREYVSGKKEKFLTTHHERDEETGLDYRGARFYDADIGRFLSLDPLARVEPSWTAYRYAKDNPIKFVDPDGLLEIEHLKESNPSLYKYLNNLMSTYNNKPGAFKEAFKEFSQLNDRQIMAILTSGQGPRVDVAALKKANGATSLNIDSNGNVIPGTITLNKKLVDDFESVYGKGFTALGELESKTLELSIESTVFHELTHYGDALDGKMDKTATTKTKTFGGTRIGFVSDGIESGKIFERKVYGQDLLDGRDIKGKRTSDHYGDARNHILRTNPGLAQKIRSKQIQRDNTRTPSN